MSAGDAIWRRQAHLLAAVGIVGLTLALRAAWLGRLGLQGDEDISTLAFRGILSTGLPVLPSGFLYWRAPLYSYLAAPLAAPGIDWLPRVFSVLLAGLSAVLVIRLGTRWVGRPAALLGAVFFALSRIEIHTGRQARFYALYQPLALVVLYALDRFAASGAWRWALVAMGTGVTAMASHELGVTLAVLFALPLLRPISRPAQLAGIGMVGLFGTLGIFQRRLIGASMTGGFPTVSQTQRRGTAAVEEMLAAGGPVTGGSGLTLLIALALLGGLLGWWASRDRPAFDRLVAAAGCALVTGLAGAHQVGAALCGLAALVLASPELFSVLRARRALGALGLALGLVAAAWAAHDLAHGVSLRHVVRDLGGGPLVMGMSLLRPPAVAVPALVGAAAVLVGALRGKRFEGPRFLLLCAFILTAVRGLLASKMSDRYMADVWPLWELLAAWTIVEGMGSAARLSQPAARALRWGVAVAVTAMFVLLPGTAPAQTLRYLDRPPGVPVHGVVPPMVPDLRGAARFVKEHAAQEDRIAATDWLSTYCYAGRVDYWLRSDAWAHQAVLRDGVPHDIYLGARVVPTLGDLEALAAGRPLWVIAGGLELYEEDEKLDPTLRAFLRTQPAVWQGSDGWTRVLRLIPPEMRAAR